MVDPSNIIPTDTAAVCEAVDFRPLEGKRVLVTGASGLIGGYLTACLYHLKVHLGHHITVYAVVRSGVPAHLKVYLDCPGTTVIQGDLTSPPFWNEIPRSDWIIHAAGYGQPSRFLQDPVKTLALNTSTTLALFEKLAPSGRFLFVSTSEVYSGLPGHRHRETEIGRTTPAHPRACYIEGKRSGEAICNAYRERGVEAKSARLALAYGPGTRQGDGRVINNFIEKGLKGDITLLDRGEATRTYCYVSDAVEILWRILLEGKDPVYNVGGTSRITIRDLALAIGEYLGVAVLLPEVPAQMSGAPGEVGLHMGRVREEFGKKRFIPLKVGLPRTIEWQRAFLGLETIDEAVNG